MSEYNTEYSIQNALSLYYDYLKFVIVDNLDSIVGHECDLLILNNITLYAQEIEIKISKADLKKDASKNHHHESNMIKKLWFAFPVTMDNQDCFDLVPVNAGILIVKSWRDITIRREAIINKNARKWASVEAFKLARLAHIRMWKYRLNNARNKGEL
jgi:hypothetical protein